MKPTILSSFFLELRTLGFLSLDTTRERSSGRGATNDGEMMVVRAQGKVFNSFGRSLSFKFARFRKSGSVP